MTTEELAKLTDEQKRIRIAELCGWKKETRNMYGGVKNVQGWGMNTHLGLGSADRKFTMHPDTFPDYLHDLNAMHEAEETLTDFQLQAFGDQLQQIVNYYCVGVVPDYHRHLMCLAKIAHATASQRSDAFLLTLG